MKYVLPSLIFVILLAPVLVLADNHTGASRFLVSIPGLSTNNGGPTNFDTYINAVYAMFISIAALLAVVKLIIAGVKYMFTDIVTQKSEAKKDIRGALIGLLIIIGAVLILTVINPNLTNFSLNVQPAANTTVVSSAATPEDPLKKAQVEGSQVKTCVKEESEITSCEQERESCTKGGYFSDDPTRTGSPDERVRNGVSTITCDPNKNEAEKAEDLRKALVNVVRVDCESAGYGWDASAEVCKQKSTRAQQITIDDVFADTTKYQAVLDSLAADGYDVRDQETTKAQLQADMLRMCLYISRATGQGFNQSLTQVGTCSGPSTTTLGANAPDRFQLPPEYQKTGS